MGETMASAMEKAGHEVYPFTRVDDAMTAISQKKIDYMIVDCMLPGSQNGVDFVVNVRKNFPQNRSRFILMSAVFTDRDFVKEAMNRTKASAFIEKKSGMDFQQILSLLVQDDGPVEVMPARRILYGMFGKEKVSAREKRKILESLEEVSGFDLPFVYSLLVETKSSGYLNIYEKNGNVSGISISDGTIVTVDVEDRTTFLGEMLIQSGYVRPEHVQEALKERTNQKIGARLIRANQLSPHAFDLILTEQMNIRLSRTVTDQTIRINFATAEVEGSSQCIDSELLLSYLHDWIASKISTSWLKSLYMIWSGNIIVLSPAYKEDHPSLQMGLVRALPGLVDLLKSGKTLNQLLEHEGYKEAAVYKGLHFLLTRGMIIFGAKAAYKSDAEQQVALRKIWNDLQGKNSFEICDFLGSENLAGEGLLALLGASPADLQSPSGILWTNLRNKISEAARAGQDGQSRARFMQDSANKDAEAKLKASQRLEEARQKLSMNQFAPALTILQEVQKNFPQMEGLHLSMAWAKIGTITPERKGTMIKEIEFELVQISAEEKYDAHYPFVLGLFHRLKGDLLGAKKQLEKAVAMNSSLMAARRELSAVEAQVKKDKDLFGSVDLKGMVAGFFKKR